MPKKTMKSKKAATPGASAPRKNKGGRPRIAIDYELLGRLAACHCRDNEMADILGISVDTLERRKQDDPRFAEILSKERANRKMALRQAQWENALGGNFTMQIWLGKQHLGQKDRQTTEVEIDVAHALAQIGQALGDLIRDFVPPERWDDAMERVQVIDDTISSRITDRDGREKPSVH